MGKNKNTDIVENYIQKIMNSVKNYLQKNHTGPIEDVYHPHTEMLIDEVLKNIQEKYKLPTGKSINWIFEEPTPVSRSVCDTFFANSFSLEKFESIKDSYSYLLIEKNFKILLFENYTHSDSSYLEDSGYEQEFKTLVIIAEHNKFYVKKIITFAKWNQMYFEYYKDDYPCAEHDIPVLQIYVELYCKESFLY
jgi:hypothetical protein